MRIIRAREELRQYVRYYRMKAVVVVNEKQVEYR